MNGEAEIELRLAGEGFSFYIHRCTYLLVFFSLNLLS